MKATKIISLLIIVGLIAVYLTGILENYAFSFVESVQKRNIDFLGLISEIKLVFAGLGTLDIPFLNGHSDSFQNSLNKVENYLLFTNVVSFIQLLLIAASKSWFVKGIVLLLFVLSLIKQTKKHAKKFLLLSLALGPGLQLFVIGVQELSNHSSIDFGEEYLVTLKERVNNVKKEKSLIMLQHAKDMTRISNGHKGIVPLRKLKEDITYDFKRLGNSIDGDFKEIRLLISTAGNEMTTRVFGFCSMILFCLLLMPSGYTAIVYIMFNSLFKHSELSEALGKIAKHPNLNVVKTETEQLAEEVNSSIIKPSTASIEAKLQTHTNALKTEVSTIISKAHSEVLDHVQQEKVKLEKSIKNAKKNLGEGTPALKHDVDLLKAKVQAHTDNLKDEFTDMVTKANADMLEHLEQEKMKLSSSLKNDK